MNKTIFGTITAASRLRFQRMARSVVCWTSLITALGMTLCVALCAALVGCRGNDQREASAATVKNGIDIRERVNVVLYMVGDAPRDLDSISEEINKMSIKDLNCTVTFEYSTWSDYMQRYSLQLSSGQPIDLIFTCEWLNYNQFARKGAFQELDGLLPRCAPELTAFVPTDYWNAVRVDGKIYTIPATWHEYANEGFLYREDLRKKYGLPVPDSLAKMEAYLAGIKEHRPNAYVTAENVIDNGYGPTFSATNVLTAKYAWVDQNMPYGLRAEYARPSKVSEYWGSSDFIADMKMLKRWSGKGFWTKSALSNKNPINELFIGGYSAAVISGINPVKYGRTVSLMRSKDPSVEVGYIPYGRLTGLVKPVHPIHNGFAIPHSARNPERALMLYEKLVLDERYNRLTQYGIEGKHYRISADGYYEMIGDVDSNGFPYEAMNGWAWRNPKYMLFDRDLRVALDLFKEFDAYAKPDIFSGFVEDYSSYQAERAALYQVQSQYLAPIQAGMVDDVERATREFMTQANAAGLRKIQAEYIRQWRRYCAERGLK